MDFIRSEGTSHFTSSSAAEYQVLPWTLGAEMYQQDNRITDKETIFAWLPVGSCEYVEISARIFTQNKFQGKIKTSKGKEPESI